MRSSKPCHVRFIAEVRRVGTRHLTVLMLFAVIGMDRAKCRVSLLADSEREPILFEAYTLLTVRNKIDGVACLYMEIHAHACDIYNGAIRFAL